jgi:hypothetical protein
LGISSRIDWMRQNCSPWSRTLTSRAPRPNLLVLPPPPAQSRSPQPHPHLPLPAAAVLLSGELPPPPCLPAFSFFHAPSLTPNPQPRAALPPWTSVGQQEQHTAGASRRGCWSSALDSEGGLDLAPAVPNRGSAGDLNRGRRSRAAWAYSVTPARTARLLRSVEGRPAGEARVSSSMVARPNSGGASSG